MRLFFLLKGKCIKNLTGVLLGRKNKNIAFVTTVIANKYDKSSILLLK